MPPFSTQLQIQSVFCIYSTSKNVNSAIKKRENNNAIVSTWTKRCAVSLGGCKCATINENNTNWNTHGGYGRCISVCSLRRLSMFVCVCDGHKKTNAKIRFIGIHCWLRWLKFSSFIHYEYRQFSSVADSPSVLPLSLAHSLKPFNVICAKILFSQLWSLN